MDNKYYVMEADISDYWSVFETLKSCQKPNEVTLNLSRLDLLILITCIDQSLINSALAEQETEVALTTRKLLVNEILKSQPKLKNYLEISLTIATMDE